MPLAFAFLLAHEVPSSACKHKSPLCFAQRDSPRVSPAEDLTRCSASGTQNQYSQIYGLPGDGNNYTSPLLHTIRLTGLSPKTRYYYQCALPPEWRPPAVCPPHRSVWTFRQRSLAAVLAAPSLLLKGLSMPWRSLQHGSSMCSLLPSLKFSVCRCRVGDGVTMSQIYDFTTLPAVGSNERVKIVVTADMGERTRHFPQNRVSNRAQTLVLGRSGQDMTHDLCRSQIVGSQLGLLAPRMRSGQLAAVRLTKPSRLNIPLMRTVGTTHATNEVLTRFTEGHDPDIVLLAGDHT